MTKYIAIAALCLSLFAASLSVTSRILGALVPSSSPVAVFVHVISDIRNEKLTALNNLLINNSAKESVSQTPHQ